MRADRLAALAALAAISAAPAFAHEPFAGFEGVYRGLLHPGLEPHQGLLIAASGLMAGRQGREGHARAWLAFAIAALAGVALGFWLSGRTASLDLALLSVTALLAAAAALTARLPARLQTGLAALGGLLAGANAVPEAGPLAAMAVTTLGALAGGVLAMGYAGAGALFVARQAARHAWLAIALRVLASWIAAAALLLIAFALRPAGLKATSEQTESFANG